MTEQNSQAEHERDCANCSPFSICSTAPGFPIFSESHEIIVPALKSARIYCKYLPAPKTGYHTSLFQPPEN